MIGSHNFIESDSSNTRDDLYVTGNSWTLNMDKFMSWYNMSTDGTFSMDLMSDRAANRFEETKMTNPNFYYGPVTGLIARNAGYIFPGRLFRNHSREEPEGVLSTSPIIRLADDKVIRDDGIKLTASQPRSTSATSSPSMARKTTSSTVRDGSASPRTGTRRPWTSVWSS